MLKNAYASSYIFLNLLKEPESGYNLSTLNAMATGIPIITLKHPESPISNGWNGLVIRNHEELHEAIQYLYQNKEKAKELGNNARKTVELFFNIDDFKTNWKEVIEALVQK